MRRLSSMFSKSNSIISLTDESSEFRDHKRFYAVDVGQEISILTKAGFTNSYWGEVPDSTTRMQHTPYLDFQSAHTVRRSRMNFRTHRCIIFLDSFYSWSLKDRRPVRVLLEDESILIIPGIYFEEDQGNIVSLLTRRPRKSLRSYVQYEPLCLNPENIDSWLKDDRVDKHIALLGTVLLKPMYYYTITNKVMVPGYSDKTLHDRTNQETTLFS